MVLVSAHLNETVFGTPNQRQECQAMTTFEATTEGTDKLGLRAVLERYANDQWLPDYYDDEQRV